MKDDRVICAPRAPSKPSRCKLVKENRRMSIDRHQSVRRQSGYIVPITRDDERVNIPRPELAAMMDPDDAKIDHTADLGH
jgi:hypothetical protein